MRAFSPALASPSPRPQPASGEQPGPGVRQHTFEAGLGPVPPPGSLSASTDATPEPSAAPHSAAQRVKVGKQDVVTAQAMADILSLQKQAFIDKFNQALGELPPADENKINGYLGSKTSKVSKGVISQADDYIRRLVNGYIRTYMQREGGEFLKEMATVESGQEYTTLVDTEGINYLEGEDDGVSVEDQYRQTLACSLYALLELKPGFLGANTPKQLHYVLRLNDDTKDYDNDKEVAKIRLSAGLRYRAPASNEDTVSKFMSRLTQNDQNRKFIIDPKGQAHTFVLKYIQNSWKKVDNDHPGGTNATNQEIRVIWYV